MKFLSKPAAACVLLAISSLGVSCRPSSGLKEAASLQEQAARQQQSIKSMQAESDALGNLGAYDHPRSEQLAQLRDHVHQLREANTQLQAEKVKAAQDLEAAQKAPRSAARSAARSADFVPLARGTQ